MYCKKTITYIAFTIPTFLTIFYFGNYNLEGFYRRDCLNDRGPRKNYYSHLVINSIPSLRTHKETLQILHKTTQLDRSKPQLQDSTKSPSGKFILHFDRLGENAVPALDLSNNGIPDYIDSAAVIFDYVWRKEIDEIGFQPPLNETGDPVENYHIYFIDLSELYGKTFSDNEIKIRSNFSRFTSYAVMDNDYQEGYYFVNDLDALRVTAAHEFNHAIQLSYGVHWDDQNPIDLYFMEMTSTWVEDVVYNDINRYLEYLPILFENFSNTSINSVESLFPYANALFLKMLVQQFGWDIVLDIWEKVKEIKSIDAMRKVFPLYDTSLLLQLHQYGLWLNYTSEDADPNLYFQEGHLYPNLNYQFKDTYRLVDQMSLADQISPLSSKLVQINIPKGGNFSAILQSNSSELLISHLSENIIKDKIPVNQKTFLSFNPESQMKSVITNAGVDTLAVEYSMTQAITNDQQPVIAFPNPVKFQQDKEVVFMNLPEDSRITLYSSDGSRIKNIDNPSYTSRIAWDLKKENGQIVSTGVYLYVVKKNTVISKGKIAIIR